MCAIVDADRLHQVFGENRSEAGEFFFEWISNGSGLLVVGGQVRAEMDKYSKFKAWFRTALKFGRARTVDDNAVEFETVFLRGQRICKSNDVHVLALARVSGARLLFTNDGNLQRDFGDPKIIRNPRGSVYSTRVDLTVSRTHRELLARANHCSG